MKDYEAFGLLIRSEVALKAAVATGREGAEPDVVVRVGNTLADPRRDGLTGDGNYAFAGDVHRFSWPELGLVEIAGGRTVTVHPVCGVADGLVEHVLLGPVIADILMTRGFLPLHASSVQVGGGVVAFVGRSGMGKSTLAAALEAQRSGIHTDDLVPIAPADLLVPYGIGRVKLNPDSAVAIGHDPNDHPPVYSGIAKRSKSVQQGSNRSARRMLCIYRLRDGDSLRFERIDPRKALFELFANCFRVEVAQHSCGAKELLRRCSIVAQQVPLYDLYRPRDLARLSKVAAALQLHAEQFAAELG